VETKLPSSRRVPSIMVNESGLPLTAIEDNTVLAFGAGGANIILFIVIIYNMEDTYLILYYFN
jgi:hypothetical protein